MVSITKVIAKTVIPQLGIAKIKKNNILFEQLLLKWSAINPLASLFYYICNYSHFYREYQGVIYGKLKYSQLLESTQNSSYLLRRNIHRLEKGLLMKPRKEIFAADYIIETVDCYKKTLQANQNSLIVEEELQWAYDVLQEYFSIVINHPKVEQAKTKFIALKHLCNPKKYIPYKRNIEIPSPVTYEQFWKLSYRRRSVRWYLPMPVPRELLDKAIMVASLSPSACNRQPFEFRIFDQPELVQQVSALPMGTKGFNHNVPVIIAVVGKLSAYFSVRDRHLIYIDASLVSMSFMYALETLGLSSCPINWPDIDTREKKMSSLLNLEPDERVIMLISVGYPDPEGMVAYSQKKSLNQVRRYN
jgi:nitroreductase